MINILTKLIPVIYSDLNPSLKGRSWGFFIQIGNKYKEDKGLLAHERCHVRQFWKLGMIAILIGATLVALGYNYGILMMALIPIHSTIYKYSSLYRYRCEMEAFGYSLAYGNRTKSNVRWTLEHDYTIPTDTMKDFDIDIEIAIDNAREDIDELAK